MRQLGSKPEHNAKELTMVKIIVKIGQIDHYMFCGRDLHPTDSDTGLFAEVIKVEHESMTLPNEDGTVDDDEVTTCFTVLTQDGRTLELVEHEIESYEIEKS